MNWDKIIICLIERQPSEVDYNCGYEVINRSSRKTRKRLKVSIEVYILTMDSTKINAENLKINFRFRYCIMSFCWSLGLYNADIKNR